MARSPHHAPVLDGPAKLAATTTVGELVADRPKRSRVFEKLGIDYCCGGKKPLAEAAREKGLDPQTIVAMLEVMESHGPADHESNPANMSLTELCDHI